MLLVTFSKTESTDLESDDFVDPDFNIKDFDISKPHSIIEWQSYFFACPNLDRDFVDVTENPVVRLNLHAMAFKTYVKKKMEKGLVKEMPNVKKGFG